MKGELARVWVTTILVTDFGKSIPFYRDILGLKVQLDARKFNWVELGPDEPLCKVGLTEVEPRKDGRPPPWVTGIVFETHNVEELHERLVANGVKFTLPPAKQPWGGIVANFLDPDGNELQVVQHAISEHYSARYEPEGEPSLRA